MDYDRTRAMAARLILKFGSGRTATLYRRTSTLDPLTGAETSSEAAHVIEVVVVPDRDAIRADARAIDYDVRFMVPATGLAIVPEPGDEVLLPLRQGRFAIVAPVERIAPDGEDVVYTLYARKVG